MKSLPLVRPLHSAEIGAPDLHRSVMLICMPFQWVHHAPLSTALLATVLRSEGVPTTELYLHLELARLYGLTRYERNEHDQDWGAELLFTEQMCAQPPLPENYEAVLETRFGPRAARDAVFRKFAEHCHAELQRHPQPDLVGLSTTFQQLTASLWMAREIRRIWPETKIAFGGGPCDAPMGQAIKQAYPEVDYVIGGRGERLLLRLLRSDPWPAPGFEYDAEGASMDTLPLVDYDEFARQFNRYAPAMHRIAGFDDAARAPDEREGAHAGDWDRFSLLLNFESSKGCWYGQKNHCKFCGLGSNMKYEAKASTRTLQEIDHLWKRYGKDLAATDAILSQEYLTDLLPELARREGPKPAIFYEVKANMSREDVRLLSAANVRLIQPGIESLSSKLLQLLDKGVRAIQNIALLKWARETEIQVNWNLIFGIPGETASEYLAIVALIPHLSHFSPPSGPNKVHLDRYSPYFNRHKEFGWESLRPSPMFRLLHPELSDEAVAALAWSFEATSDAFLPIEEYLPQLRAAIEDWRRRHRRGDGLFWTREDGLFRRTDGEFEVYETTPELQALIESTHSVIGIDKLIATCNLDEGDLEAWTDEGVLFREGDKIVNLAVDRSPEAHHGQL